MLPTQASVFTDKKMFSGACGTGQRKEKGSQQTDSRQTEKRTDKQAEKVKTRNRENNPLNFHVSQNAVCNWSSNNEYSITFYRNTNREIGRRTSRPTGRHTDRQAGRQTDRQTGRQT